jgi:hypothetical protein
MKKVFCIAICVLLAVTVGACAPKTLESVMGDSMGQAEAAMNQALADQGMMTLMNVEMTVSGNTLTYNYHFIDPNVTKANLGDEGQVLLDSVGDWVADDTATLEQTLKAESRTRGIGKVTVVTNIYDANDELLNSTTTETGEI